MNNGNELTAALVTIEKCLMTSLRQASTPQCVRPVTDYVSKEFSMTDITELARHMKAAAVLAKKYRSLTLTVSVDETLALVEALEKSRTQSSKWLEGYHKAVSIGARYEERIAELEGAEKKLCAANVTLDARAELAERQLESRTVTIEPFRSFVTDADLAALHRFAECCDDPESGGHDLEKEQVRRLEAIGALQRSGRISYITSFGDVLISITAGIKVETE